MTTVFHCSDLHFGHPAVPEQYEAMESLIATRGYDVVAISGDLSQRARSGEFQRARAFIRHAAAYSRVIVIPGNHDVQWWKSPLGLGDPHAMGSHLTHRITGIRRIRMVVDPDGRDARVEFDTKSGTCTLDFIGS